MRYRKLGTSGIEASVVGLGTWVMGGGAFWGDEPDDDESIRTIHAALDQGINLIDTAPVYGFGRSEEVVGRAIRDRRDAVVLATKCGLLWGEGCERGVFHYAINGVPTYRSLRPDTIREELEASLRRLRTDYIDLYQTHWQAIDPVKTPIEETMACLTELRDEGKIRAIGASNASAEDIRAYHQTGALSAIQPRYSLLCRDIEEDILPLCEGEGIAVLAYMPLEQGLLTGKVGMDRQFKDGEIRANESKNPWFKPENRRQVLKMLEAWKPLTLKYDGTLTQLSLAATLAQPGLSHVLCGARRAEQARENAAAGDRVLEPDDLSTIRRDIENLGQPQ